MEFVNNRNKISEFKESVVKKVSLRILFVMTLLAMISACGSEGVTVTTSFANTQDVEEGATVYFDSEAVAEVVDVKIQGSGTVVVLEFEEKAAQIISADAALVVNRLVADAPLELYNSGNYSAGYIQDGQEITGLDSMMQLGAWKIGDTVQVGSESLKDYVNAFQEYLQSDEFQEDKKSARFQVNSVTNQAQDAITTIGNDLTAMVEELADSEADAAQVVEQLGAELSPLIQDVAKSGSELMQQLEEFTKGLEQIEIGEQESGQVFLDSLASMFEKLNESIEEGVNEGLEKQNTDNAE